MMASPWHTRKAKSGEVLFYFNIATGEKLWPNDCNQSPPGSFSAVQTGACTKDTAAQSGEELVNDSEPSSQETFLQNVIDIKLENLTDLEREGNTSNSRLTHLTTDANHELHVNVKEECDNSAINAVAGQMSHTTTEPSKDVILKKEEDLPAEEGDNVSSVFSITEFLPVSNASKDTTTSSTLATQAAERSLSSKRDPSSSNAKTKGHFPCHFCSKVLRSHAFLERHLKLHKKSLNNKVKCIPVKTSADKSILRPSSKCVKSATTRIHSGKQSDTSNLGKGDSEECFNALQLNDHEKKTEKYSKNCTPDGKTQISLPFPSHKDVNGNFDSSHPYCADIERESHDGEPTVNCKKAKGHFPCEFCSKVLSSSASLKRHEKCHDKNTEKKTKKKVCTSNAVNDFTQDVLETSTPKDDPNKDNYPNQPNSIESVGAKGPICDGEKVQAAIVKDKVGKGFDGSASKKGDSSCKMKTSGSQDNTDESYYQMSTDVQQGACPNDTQANDKISSENTDNTPKKKGSFPCHLCSKILRSSVFLKSHLKRHEEATNKKCLGRVDKDIKVENFAQPRSWDSGEETSRNEDMVNYTDELGQEEVTSESATGAKGVKHLVKGKSLKKETKTKGKTAACKEKSFYCDFCPRAFFRNHELIIHRRRHLGEKPYACKHPGCSKAFAESGDLSKHTMRHIGFRPHRCSECQKAFFTAANLRKHELIHNGVKSFKCELCEKLFLRASSLEMHVRTHTGYKPFKCTECGRDFQRSGLLVIHVRRAHTFERPYKCTNCDRAFYDGTDLRKHMRCHTKEKPYVCTFCNKAFSQSGTLTKHLQIHRVGDPFPCKQCGKSFQNMRYLKRHEFLHTNKKPYKCHVCDKTFAQGNNLKTHIRSHTGERPFECVKCNSRFSQAPHLKKHLSLQGCEHARYKCQTCSSRFINSSALKSHLRSHMRTDTGAATTLEFSQLELPKLEMP